MINQRFAHSRSALLALAAAAFAIFLAGGAFTLAIAPDPKNAVIFGFSALRLLLFGALVAMGAACLAAGIRSYRRGDGPGALLVLDRRPALARSVRVLLPALAIWGWVSTFLSAEPFGRWMYLYDRLRPASIALGIAALGLWAVLAAARGSLDLDWLAARPRQKNFPFAAFFASTLILTLLVALTGFGLISDLPYWNVPGIPLSVFQFIPLVFSVAAASAVSLRLRSRWSAQAAWMAPVLIYIGAVLLWGFTPMIKHFFALEPAPPTFQYYPYSDARLYDTGAISILRGTGISFHWATDKPLYHVFLAIFHLFAGYDYDRMAWAQVIVLALIPVILYFLGTKLHSPAFGLFAALTGLLRLRNTIVLSYRVSSANPKILVTEVMTLLGVVLAAYLLVRWFAGRQRRDALLAGGAIGAASLVRLNPVFLFPAGAALAVLFFYRSRRMLGRHLSLYTLGFLILWLPWLITGVTPEGIPWVFIKIRDVFNTRFEDPSPTPPRPDGGAAPVQLLASLAPPPLAQAEPPVSAGQVAVNFTSHFTHNLTTSVLALPDLVQYDDLVQLSLRPYWDENSGWDGRIAPAQVASVVINLALLSAGLSLAWSRRRWLGLVPLVVYLAYCVGIAAAMVSGGRYLVACDWVLYFYYGLGVMALIEFAFRLFKLERAPLLLDRPRLAPQDDRPRDLWSAAAVLVLAASLIPAANLLLPQLIAPRITPAQAAGVEQAIPTDPRLGEYLVLGEAVYPRITAERTFTFAVITRRDAPEFAYDDQVPSLRYLADGDLVAVKARRISGVDEVLAVYALTGGSLQKVWERPNP